MLPQGIIALILCVIQIRCVRCAKQGPAPPRVMLFVHLWQG